MDRTELNIISIFLGGVGLFGALSGFNVPEVNETYYDVNLYAIRRDAIERTTKVVFTGVALFGLLVRLYAEVSGRSSHSHDRKHYNRLSFALLLAGILLVWVGGEGCKQIAEWQWKPKVVEVQRKSFVHAKCIADQLEHARCVQEQDRRVSDREVAEQELGQIEKFWGVESSGELQQRIKRLQPMFPK